MSWEQTEAKSRLLHRWRDGRPQNPQALICGLITNRRHICCRRAGGHQSKTPPAATVGAWATSVGAGSARGGCVPRRGRGSGQGWASAGGCMGTGDARDAVMPRELPARPHSSPPRGLPTAPLPTTRPTHAPPPNPPRPQPGAAGTARGQGPGEPGVRGEKRRPSGVRQRGMVGGLGLCAAPSPAPAPLRPGAAPPAPWAEPPAPLRRAAAAPGAAAPRALGPLQHGRSPPPRAPARRLRRPPAPLPRLPRT